jgi:catechol-2,3-dioxygenase
MMNLEAIDHIAISVRSLEASFTWYAQVLGFQLYHKWHTTWMVERNGAKIGMFLRPAALPIEDLDNRIALQHFAFRIALKEFELAKETLQQLGVAFEGPEDSGIAQSIFLRDPDGHQVEITAYYDTGSAAHPLISTDAQPVPAKT